MANETNQTSKGASSIQAGGNVTDNVINHVTVQAALPRATAAEVKAALELKPMVSEAQWIAALNFSKKTFGTKKLTELTSGDCGQFKNYVKGIIKNNDQATAKVPTTAVPLMSSPPQTLAPATTSKPSFVRLGIAALVGCVTMFALYAWMKPKTAIELRPIKLNVYDTSFKKAVKSFDATSEWTIEKTIAFAGSIDKNQTLAIECMGYNPKMQSLPLAFDIVRPNNKKDDILKRLDSEDTLHAVCMAKAKMLSK